MRDLIEDLRCLTESGVPTFTKFVDEWETDDYPSGRHRVKAKWVVQKKGKKSRAARVTHHPKTGKPSKPKATTYALITKLGVGSDDRIYIVQFTEYGQVVITPGTMKYPTYLHPKDAGYDELAKKLGVPDGLIQQIKSA